MLPSVMAANVVVLLLLVFGCTADFQKYAKQPGANILLEISPLMSLALDLTGFYCHSPSTCASCGPAIGNRLARRRAAAAGGGAGEAGAGAGEVAAAAGGAGAAGEAGAAARGAAVPETGAGEAAAADKAPVRMAAPAGEETAASAAAAVAVGPADVAVSATPQAGAGAATTVGRSSGECKPSAAAAAAASPHTPATTPAAPVKHRSNMVKPHATACSPVTHVIKPRATAPITQQQHGVLRTNCIDCLDRTNVVQFAYGLAAFGRQLLALGVSDESELDSDSSMAFNLMEMYEAMGHNLALQYGGSEAHAGFFQKKRGEWETTTQSRDLVTSIR